MIRRLFSVPASASRGRALLHRILIGSAIACFAGAAALGLVPESAPSAPPVQHFITRPLPLAPRDMQVGRTGFAPFINETHIRRDDTLAAVLRRLKADDPDLRAFLARTTTRVASTISIPAAPCGPPPTARKGWPRTC